MRSSSITRPAWSVVRRRVEKTPLGASASSKTCSIASAHWGTLALAACLRSATLPAMSAGAAKRKTCQKGKFQGITASTAPSGS